MNRAAPSLVSPGPGAEVSASTAGSPVIRVSGLEKSYDGVPVLNGVDLDVARGELIAIIGRSGCGKSTFLRCLNGLEPWNAGRVEIAGVELTATAGGRAPRDHGRRVHALRGKVGMVFQAFNLFSHRTVLDNLTLAPMVVRGESRAEAERTARELLEKVGLSALAHRHPGTLSGGQQQRAAIARALAMSPEVMLYDEPTSSLDPELVDEVLEVMRALDREGMTQVVVTHEMRFARDASDYVIYMEAGEFVERGAPDRMFSDPRDDRTRQYLRRFL